MDKTQEGILERLKADIPDKYKKTTGSYVCDILSAVAIGFAEVYEDSDRAVKKMLIATATGEDLDRLLSDIGYERKKASYATGRVTVTGAAGAEIKSGDLCGAGFEMYEFVNSCILTDGTALADIRAVMPGNAGNCAAGKVNYFPVTLPQITSVTNPEPITGGADAETDDELKERYYYFLDNPVTSGNAFEYEQWAREVDGVGFAKCYPLRGESLDYDTPGTVRVVICTDEMGVPDTKLIGTVSEYIGLKRVIGPSVTVTGAEPVYISVSAEVSFDPSYSITSISDTYSLRLTEYFKELGFAGGIIPYSEVGAILQRIPGINYYNSFLVNGKAENISVTDGQVAVLGGVNLEAV